MNAAATVEVSRAKMLRRACIEGCNGICGIVRTSTLTPTPSPLLNPKLQIPSPAAPLTFECGGGREFNVNAEQMYFTSVSSHIYSHRWNAFDKTHFFLQPYLSSTSALPQLHFSSTSAVLLLYFSPTSVVLQPYFSPISALLQLYVSPTSALL